MKGGKKDEGSEEEGEKSSFAAAACDIRVMERVIGEKSLWSLDIYESFLRGGR